MPRAGVIPFAYLTPIVLSALLLAACGSEDDPAAPIDRGEYVLVHHDGDSLRVYLDELPSVQIDGQDVIYLDDFVSQDLLPPYQAAAIRHDTRALYAYEIEGADGFSAHGRRGYPNNTWDQMPLGYLVKSTRRAIFPDEAIDLPGAYNVKDVRHVRVWRKFDVEIAAADTTVFYELRRLEDRTADIAFPPVGDEQHAQVLAAIPLAAFIERLVADERLDDPSGHAYRLTAIDGAVTPGLLDWQQIQTGYWLVATSRTRFTGPGLLEPGYRLTHLRRISVEASAP